MQLSYIIPAYNCENTIRETIKSIIKNSSNVSYEIIIIENGSTDQTCQKLIELSKEVSNLKVLHSAKGVSNARNLGIKCAKGDWIWFVDADDKIVCDKQKIAHALDSGADLIIGNYLVNNHKKINITKEDMIIKDNELKRKTYSMISLPNKYMTVWNKLFRASVIKNKEIYFDKTLKVAEDSEFVFRILKYVKKIYLTNDTIYLYETYDNSTVRSLNIKSINEYTLAMRKMNCYFEVENNNLNIAISKYIYINFVISMVRGVFARKNLSLKSKLKIVKKTKNISVYQNAIKRLSFSDVKKLAFIPGIFLKYNFYLIPTMIFQLKSCINSKNEFAK